MATMTALKPGSLEGEKMQFRTQMVNGKPQIYFDAIDESSVKPKARNPTNRPPPEQPKPKPSSQKPPIHNQTNKPIKKKHKVTFEEVPTTPGVFMTMDEISELIKVAQETAQTQPNLENVQKHNPEPTHSSPTEVPKLDLSSQHPQTQAARISPREEALGLMAEKKRQKWMREKAEMDRMKLEVEYDQLKHQLSPVLQKKSTSPERSAYPLDYSATNKPPLPSSSKPTDNAQNDPVKTRLIERKQQQWRQENSEKLPTWNPFGKPGAGAPAPNQIQQKPLPPPSNTTVALRPPDTTLNMTLNDQTHIPAAMRTNLLFGDVRFEDDVKTAKEIERRQWLEDLQRQIEENKRKKTREQESERRQEFLQENARPSSQEAANRHQQDKETIPTTTPANTNTQVTTRTSKHDSLVQQTYDKIVEATEQAKYEKKAQLIEKLKRNGHRIDLLAKTLPAVKTNFPVSHSDDNEKPSEPSPKKPAVVKIEPLRLNITNDNLQMNRTNDARRDEAVNTVNSTFRSDNSAQTDAHMMPHKQMFSFIREESDLPPQVPNHLVRNSKSNKKNVRIRSVEDNQHQRNSSSTTIQSNNNNTPNDDGMTSQIGTHRSHGPADILRRPLWNYQNPSHREYVPNSKRDPFYEKRNRKPSEPAYANQTDNISKKVSYNRWNSDSELQHERQEKKMTPNNRTRSTVLKPITHKSEQSIRIPRERAPQDTFVLQTNDEDIDYNHVSSLEKYENFVPYLRTDDVLDPSKAFSPIPASRETSAHIQQAPTSTNDDYQRRHNASVQPSPYHVPPSRQEHILQQLTAIKENLVRRQQEVATSMNAIPV